MRLAIGLACLAAAGCATTTPVAPEFATDGREVFRTIRTTEPISTGLQQVPPQTFRHTQQLGRLQVFIGEFGGRQAPFVGPPQPGFGLCLDPERPAYLALYVAPTGCIEVTGYAVPAVTVESR